jgi:hypothetical protein
MALNAFNVNVSVTELFDEARRLQYTRSGEMFDSENIISKNKKKIVKLN